MKNKPSLNLLRTLVFLSFLILLVAACTPADTETPALGADQDAIDTAVALTLAAQPTDTPFILPTVAPPDPTATEVPTEMPEPTQTSTVLPTATPITGDPVDILGEPTWLDEFETRTHWGTFENDCFKSEITDGRYIMNGKLAMTCWELTWPEIFNLMLNLYRQRNEKA